MNSTTTPKTGLRERKAAKLKLNLLDLLMKKLQEKPFTEISLEELCAEAMISKVTFFNYFPSKDSMLDYLALVWAFKFKMNCRIKNLVGMEAIEHLFELTGNGLYKTGDQAVHLLAAVMQRKLPADRQDTLSLMEKKELFPESDDFDWNFTPKMGVFFTEHLNFALQSGELKTDLSNEEVLVLVAGMYHGSANMVVRRTDENPFSIYSFAFKTLKKILNYSPAGKTTFVSV